jgi:hypothetical protein
MFAPIKQGQSLLTAGVIRGVYGLKHTYVLVRLPGAKLATSDPNHSQWPSALVPDWSVAALDLQEGSIGVSLQSRRSLMAASHDHALMIGARVCWYILC